MRVAIYVRVSKEDGSQTTENQLLELRQYCNRQGMEVVAEYRDCKTGSSAERDQFKEMMSDAHKRKFDLVVFWALDRFSREGAFKTLGYFEQLKNARVGWRSYREAYIDSTVPAFGDMFICMMATFAAMERERLIERTKSGLARARSEGRILGRPRIDVKPWELRRMQKEGKSLRAIAAETGLSYGVVSRSLAA